MKEKKIQNQRSYLVSVVIASDRFIHEIETEIKDYLHNCEKKSEKNI